MCMIYLVCTILIFFQKICHILKITYHFLSSAKYNLILLFTLYISGLTKPLDATRQIILPSPSDSPNSIVTGIYQYYLQLTPTTVFRSLGMKTQTYQQSYTKHFQRLDFAVNAASVPGMPGIFFMYKVRFYSIYFFLISFIFLIRLEVVSVLVTRGERRARLSSFHHQPLRHRRRRSGGLRVAEPNLLVSLIRRQKAFCQIRFHPSQLILSTTTPVGSMRFCALAYLPQTVSYLINSTEALFWQNSPS